MDSAGGLLSLSYNQEGDCLSVSTETGFAVFHTRPFEETVRLLGVAASSLICCVLPFCCGAAVRPSRWLDLSHSRRPLAFLPFLRRSCDETWAAG